MTKQKPMVAFGRYPCCDAVRPLKVPEDRHAEVRDSCPSCGTRIVRVFNGRVHVIALREPARLPRTETRVAFKTGHREVNAGPMSAA